MARHNRDAVGHDQRDFEYQVSYQPDWLRSIKVTRTLESGRQSTKALFKNPEGRERAPGSRVRTRIVCAAQDLEFEVAIHDPRRIVRKITVETGLPSAREAADTVVFTFEDMLPSKRR